MAAVLSVETLENCDIRRGTFPTHELVRLYQLHRLKFSGFKLFRVLLFLTLMSALFSLPIASGSKGERNRKLSTLTFV
jgi:hypothetical protein